MLYKNTAKKNLEFHQKDDIQTEMVLLEEKQDGFFIF